MRAQYFDDMDELYDQACELESAIESCVSREEYGRAAEHTKEYRALQECDAVFTIMQVGTFLHYRMFFSVLEAVGR